MYNNSLSRFKRLDPLTQNKIKLEKKEKNLKEIKLLVHKTKYAWWDGKCNKKPNLKKLILVLFQINYLHLHQGKLCSRVYH